MIPDDKNSNNYEKIKQLAELECGVLTQCIRGGTVYRVTNDRDNKWQRDGSSIHNILLKVNAKLNGTNHRLQTNQIDDKVLMKMEKCMLIGADVTHPSPDQQSIPRYSCN